MHRGRHWQTKLLQCVCRLDKAPAAGTIQYQERHTATTNAQGLFNVQIGAGAVLSGTFANITWADAQQKHLQIELDPTGGTTYTNMGTQQLVSVPFAMYAKEAATATNDNDTSPTNEIQTLGLAGATLSLSNGGGSVTLPTGTTYTAGTGISLTGNAITNTAPDQTVVIAGGGVTSVSGTYPNFTVTTPTPADNSPTNEIQTLSIAGNTVSLSNGGGSVALPAEVDGSVTNEIQALSLVGTTLSLSHGGGSVTLPGSSGTAWNILGNAGTNPASNFIGTTDNQPLRIRVNNQPAGQISDTNAAIGTGALQNNTSGALNTAMGTSALAANTTGNENTGIGSFALTSNTGSYNSALGSNALLNNTIPLVAAIQQWAIMPCKQAVHRNYNTAVGINAMANNTTKGYANVAVEYSIFP